MRFKWFTNDYTVLHSIQLHLTEKQNFLGNKFASHNFLSNVIIPQSTMLIVKHHHTCHANKTPSELRKLGPTGG